MDECIDTQVVEKLVNTAVMGLSAMEKDDGAFEMSQLRLKEEEAEAEQRCSELSVEVERLVKSLSSLKDAMANQSVTRAEASEFATVALNASDPVADQHVRAVWSPLIEALQPQPRSNDKVLADQKAAEELVAAKTSERQMREARP